jgi:hypothetical protein
MLEFLRLTPWVGAHEHTAGADNAEKECGVYDLRKRGVSKKAKRERKWDRGRDEKRGIGGGRTAERYGVDE